MTLAIICAVLLVVLFVYMRRLEHCGTCGDKLVVWSERKDFCHRCPSGK